MKKKQPKTDEPINNKEAPQCINAPVAPANATRHGLFSAKALIPGESPEEFEAFRKDQLSQLQVRGGVENLIADQFVITSWRLQRLERIEAEAFTRYGLSSKGEVMGPGFAMIASVQGDNFLSTLGRYEAGLRRQYFRCLDTLQALRKGHLFDYLPPPVLDVETVPPAPVVEPAPAQGQLPPVAVPSGMALDEPAAARSAGDLAPVDGSRGAPDDTSPEAKPGHNPAEPPTVPEMSRLLEKEAMQFIDFPSNCRFCFLPSGLHHCGGRNVENYETNPPRRSGLPARNVESPGPEVWPRPPPRRTGQPAIRSGWRLGGVRGGQ